MRRTVLSLVALAFLLSAVEAAAQPVVPAPGASSQRPWLGAPAVRAAAPAAPGADLAPCDEAPGALCGRVPVPLDRDEPGGEQIGIFFAVFPHTDAAAPAERTIFVTFGGPGGSATQTGGEGFVSYLFEPLRDRSDVVLIDYRGTGLSQPIDCPLLQQGDFSVVYEAVRACGEQLGDRSDLYGSEDVAADIEAVRAALGVKRFDFYGFSYAAADAQAYAVRYPTRMASAVLDSPFPLVDFDPWYTEVAENVPEIVERVCRRSENCRRDHRHPAAELAWLAKRLRAAPVDGTAFDSLGDAHAVHVDEAKLISVVLGDFGGFTAQSELAAASRALRRGDPAPLLRLAAETEIGFPPEPPELFSAGLNSARFCTDQRFQWDPFASFDERRRQFEAARADLDPRQFAPFSVDGWVSPAPLGAFPDPCIGWPAPTHERERPVPDGATAGGVPALILTAEYDIFLPRSIAEDAGEVFPRNRLIDIASSGHVAIFGPNGECAVGLVQRFFLTGRPGDRSCASRAPFEFPGVGRFARSSVDLRPAKPASPEDRSTRADRRLAAAAAATVVDAFRRTFIAGPTDHGKGLRGGAVTSVDDDQGVMLDLALARFVDDVGVTGQARYDFATSTIDANVALVVAGSQGQVQVRGVWFGPGATTITVDGQIGGRRVVVEVPAT
jgi:pimeloyl-ACP methyl ester carboxylesterase